MSPRRASSAWIGYHDHVNRVHATIRGVRAHARVLGSGQPIVLVHGLGVSGRYFVPLAHRLARRGSVLIPDLPGHGLSAAGDGSPSIVELSEALCGWLDEQQLESAPLVGNSLGCQVAVELAVKAPARVERLVLIGPTMDPSAPTLHRQFGRLLRDALREPLALTLVELGDYLRAGPRRVVGLARAALAYPMQATLEHVEQPTLVVRGERDPIVSQGWAERVAASLVDGRLAVVAGAPHAAHWAAADRVADLIEEFV